jgi:SulP family sulfate permease
MEIMQFQTPEVVKLWRAEFGNYTRANLQGDLIAGLTVAAVALPLALAFGVASGSTPAAGLVTAILAGFIIGALGGAPYQLSGPTGAMSAVLIIVAQQHGQRGLWIAGLMAGIMILAVGILRLGRIVHLIPAPVITGFTSGIALTIAIGQIDNALGITTPKKDRSLEKLFGYFTEPLPPINWWAVFCTLVVVVTMLLLPRFFKAPGIPTALIGVAIVTAISWGFGLDVHSIGALPQTILLDDRLTLSTSDWHIANDLLMPAITIAMLGSIESLLCGIVAGRMTKRPFAVNQELIAQGIGNIVIPFFGGVPATAAIARTSVGVKAGGVTRLVSILHAVALLIGVFFFASILGHVPTAALAGVLFVTAWRMNEWHTIRYYWVHRLKGPLATFAVTMIATVALDLTQAIIVGLVVSSILFLKQISRVTIEVQHVDWSRATRLGASIPKPEPTARIFSVSGSLFFGSVNQFAELVEKAVPVQVLIIDLARVPAVDISSIQAIEHIWREQILRDGTLYVTGMHPPVHRLFERAGMVAAIGEEHLPASIDEALAHAARKYDPLAHEEIPAQIDSDLVAFGDMPLGLQVVE